MLTPAATLRVPGRQGYLRHRVSEQRHLRDEASVGPGEEGVFKRQNRRARESVIWHHAQRLGPIRAAMLAALPAVVETRVTIGVDRPQGARSQT